jgi:hypothetical protein
MGCRLRGTSGRRRRELDELDQRPYSTGRHSWVTTVTRVGIGWIGVETRGPGECDEEWVFLKLQLTVRINNRGKGPRQRSARRRPAGGKLR